MQTLNRFFASNWKHVTALVVMLLTVFIYFNLQFSGYGLKQHDIAMHRGASNEMSDYMERTGEFMLWTNSMFGGMPTYQISSNYEGNVFNMAVIQLIKVISSPAGIVLLYMIGFYIFALCLRINQWIGLLGAMAFAFSSYDIIILQAGHNSKGMSLAFVAPVLGAFIMAYQNRLKWGLILSAIFMNIQLSMNHLQISYYMGILLVFCGLALFIQAIQNKTIKSFFMTTAGLVAVYGLALVINYGNIAMTNEYSKHTIRGKQDITISPDGKNNLQAKDGLDKDYVLNWSYGIGESFTLISPYVKGGGTVALAQSPFAEEAENLDLTSEQLKGVMPMPVYWGDQPITSGPVYVGIIVVFLAFLGIVFLKTKLKWALLATTLLCLMLSWGKNFLGLTDVFLNYVPGYNKFRAVTIILVIVELCLPVLGVLFLQLLYKEREALKEKKKMFVYVSMGFLVFLLGVKFMGLNDNYSPAAEKDQIAGVEINIRKQIMQADPAMMLSQYQLDVTNPAQVSEFVELQKQPYLESFETMKTVRKAIFNSSMNRSILFFVFGFAILMLFFYTEIKSEFALLALGIFILVDLISVDLNYLGNQEEGSGYKYWDLKENAMYPISSTTADLEILRMETENDPNLAKKVAEGFQEGKAKAAELDLTGTKANRVEDCYQFRALNRNSNYRVFDFTSGFGSANPSYFHKSLGGYHGAKLRNIQNLYEFHIVKSNNKVFDMLNVKYFIQPNQDNSALLARQNPGAMGNAWFVKQVEAYETPNEELLALGLRFDVENLGVGKLVLNDTEIKKSAAYGSENLVYVLQNDTLPIQFPNGLREGQAAYFVMDKNGKTDFVLKQMIDMDTSKSFLKLVDLTVSNEFKPREEAVMLSSEAAKLKSKKFSGEGTIKMTSYKPDELVYEANCIGNQLAVFSEIYYNAGWNAYVDGVKTDILKVDYLLRGVELKSGKHKIELKFEVPTYENAKAIAWGGSIILLLMIAYGVWSDRKAKKEAA